MENLQQAKNNMLEWWFIFSQTGNVEDARMLIESIHAYDLLLANDYELEM